MRIIFMGTPDFSVPTLNALVDAGHEIIAVVAQPTQQSTSLHGLHCPGSVSSSTRRILLASAPNSDPVRM